MTTAGSLRAALRRVTADLSPAYFAMVMATGIVSTAAYLLGMAWLALGLFAVNVVAYCVLWILYVARAIEHPGRMVADLFHHTHGAGFFTTVAATCVLGAQFILLLGDYRAASALWVLGLVLWVGVTYTVFTGLTIKEDKPPIERGISSTWLLAVVATQSVALLSCQLASYFGPYRLATNFFALSMWLWGGMLYIWMISLIFYRYTFFRFSPFDLTPPYWINMGAMAISSFTGAQLIENTPHAPFLSSTLPFLKGFTVFYWVTGTWWLPMLAILAVWRHIFKRFPFSYDPLYWGAVFPLGMYTASTLAVGESMNLPFLEPFPHYFFYVALAAWTAAFVGLLRSMAKFRL